MMNVICLIYRYRENYSGHTELETRYQCDNSDQTSILNRVGGDGGNLREERIHFLLVHLVTED